MTKRFGFTLAEVLITLGIIGVVAAMTIPTLIKNYQKTVWVNQLKKSVSIVEQGLKLAMAEDEVDNLKDTELFKSIGDENLGEGGNKEEFLKKLKKYFNTINTIDNYNNLKLTSKDYKNLNGTIIYEDGESTEFDDNFGVITYLSDGTILLFDYACNPLYINQCGLYIDVNGEKKPNQYGRDWFYFNISENGKLVPVGNNGKWEKEKDNNKYVNCDNNSYGYGCAARIIENGWKMDY